MNLEKNYTITTAADMLGLGQLLSQQLADGGLVIMLQGDLGAGKTTLTRGFLRGLGYQAAVKSPTFTLVEPYEVAGRMIYHFDLYRLDDAQSLAYIGYRDYLDGDNICIIEWPEKAAELLPVGDITCSIRIQKQGRLVKFTANTSAGLRIIQGLAE